MLAHHPTPSPRITQSRFARSRFDGGLAAVMALTVAAIAVPTIVLLTGVSLGGTVPVVASVVSVLGLYALYQSIDT